MAKIKHTRNENGQNFTHQNKATLFWRKKTKINLHQNFQIYGSASNAPKCLLNNGVSIVQKLVVNVSWENIVEVFESLTTCFWTMETS